ncbi:g10675 [Coccomyxa elongata]
MAGEAVSRSGAEQEAPIPSTSCTVAGQTQRLRDLATTDRQLTLDERWELACSVGIECIQPDELKNLLDKKPNPVAYDGFEPSGRMHIAQGVMKALNVNKLTRCKVIFKFWVADIFAQMNNKLGGDIEKIRTTGRYFVEIWKAIGMEGIGEKVLFLNASEEIAKHAREYNDIMMDVMESFTQDRILRCTQIMGRSETDELSPAQIIYPCMQCADIFFLKADICQLGLDQRKVNVLAREYCTKIKRKLKPVILSHEMLPGLLEGQEKMSKSDPNSAIFMEDSAEDVERKINNAFCPEGIIEGNPCIKYITLIILPWTGEFTVSNADGTSRKYLDAAELERAFADGALSPSDLKPALAAALNAILQPVRDHFENNAEAKQLLQDVRSFKITR